jgi:hypothetical protein
MKISDSVVRTTLAFMIAIGLMVSYLVTKYNAHQRLQSNGKTVKAISTYSEHLWVSYADYYFVTDEGVRINHSEKCGNKNSFDKNFWDLKLIYNKSNPTEFWVYEDFVKYEITGTTIIMSLIFIILLGVVFSKMLHAGAHILRNLKNGLVLKNNA